MRDDRIVIVIVMVVVLALLIGYPYLSPETPEYTAEIEMQGDKTIIVTTHKVGEIDADKLWVKFEHPSAIKITNKKGNVNDKFEYDPTKTREGDDYSISGGEKGVIGYDVGVHVYYSYGDKEKCIKKKKVEVSNPNR